MVERVTAETDTRTVGRAAVGALLVWLAATQAADIRQLGNGLSQNATAYREADAIRSADSYAREGWLAYAGLPRALYGDRFLIYSAVRSSRSRSRVNSPKRLRPPSAWMTPLPKNAAAGHSISWKIGT